MQLLIKNATYNGSIVDILVEDSIIKKIGKITSSTKNVIDAKGGLILPGFNDPHIHIDSALTAGEPRFNKSGSLFEGIEVWRERKKSLNKNDFIKRTNELFNLYVKNGVQNIRAHIDVTGESVEIVKWAVEQKKAWENKLNIQIVAFPQDGIMSTKSGKENFLKAIEYGVDVLGGIPHYEFSTKLGWESIEWVLDLAVKHNLMVDMHCDEIDDPNSKFLEHLSAEAWKRNLIGKVTASHTTAFARYNNAYVRKLWNNLQQSKINFVANPLINVHLGGRFDEVNPGRGITRVKEMIENKVNVAYGHDDVRDPWYSLGDANMMQVLFMGIHLNHLTGYDQIIDSIKLITNNSAKLMGLKDYGIKEGKVANFIILEENNVYDAIRLISKVKFNVFKGQLINEKR